MSAFSKIRFGAGLAVTEEGGGVITVSGGDGGGALEWEDVGAAIKWPGQVPHVNFQAVASANGIPISSGPTSQVCAMPWDAITTTTAPQFAFLDKTTPLSSTQIQLSAPGSYMAFGYYRWFQGSAFGPTKVVLAGFQATGWTSGALLGTSQAYDPVPVGGVSGYSSAIMAAAKLTAGARLILQFVYTELSDHPSAFLGAECSIVKIGDL